jgi:hypothetical protein
VLGVAALVGCGHVRSAPVQVPGQVTRVDVDVDHGNVEIVASADISRVEILRTARGVPESRGVQHELTAGVLKIEARCGATPGCKINHKLRVPLGVGVVLRVADGDVTLVDVSGDVQVDVGLGTINGLRLGGASVDVRTEGGNIDLIFLDPPKRCVANAAAGDVSLRVPPGNYRCDLDPKAVSRFGVHCDERSPRTLAASTAVGKLAVHATE